ncbi:perforin-1-like [Rana temporaria]|uniref:perforin-1-like n=1 Tax=Rana temporaria TaxID=8407 RepID=UPI001AAC84D0|nr:perforin-1-like [Rana temporaria]
MWLLLVLLSFATSASCQTHPPLTYDCQPAKKPQCEELDFVPGHNLLGKGFDIVTMKQTSGHLLDLQKFSSEDETCTVCHNPYMGMTWQKLPLATVDWRPQSFCSKNINSELSQSSTSLAEEAASEVKNDWKAGLELCPHEVTANLVMAGSQSEVAKFGESKTSKDRYTFIKHHLSCVYYSFRLSDPPLLSKGLSRALESLPPTYEASTKANYRRLISTYGTHFISQADVGGQVVEVNAIKTCQVTMDGIPMEELKDCLNIEASVVVNGKSEANAKAGACEELRQKFNRGKRFHETFDEMSWEIKGGKITYKQLSSDVKNGEGSASFNAWMESLKTDPDIVSYSLEPIHHLVEANRPQRESLQEAISDYILEKALSKSCSCPSGSQPSPGRKCQCVCHGGQGKNINCCPLKRGLAKVVVTLQSASNLWGDRGSRADTYVKISAGPSSAQTETIWNNDNPKWNTTIDLGVLELSPGLSVKVEVWDEDNKYDDDLLGKCEKTINSGVKEEVCYFDYGSVTFTVSLQCPPPPDWTPL